MTYWWDMFNLPKPTVLDETDCNALSTLTKTLTGVKVDFVASKDEDCPMWTKATQFDRIYFNENCESYIFGIYHEVGHLLNNLKIKTNWERLLQYRIQAEYLAIKESLKLAMQNNDLIEAENIINTTCIDNLASKYYARKEHYYARNWLLHDKEFVNLCEKIIDLKEILEYADKWEKIVDTKGTSKVEKNER